MAKHLAVSQRDQDCRSFSQIPGHVFSNNNEQELIKVLNNLNFIGLSSSFRTTARKISKFCCSKAPVLLDGETGSGKELAARALHYLGPRSNKPFIPVNCGAYPETMFENELFGHSKGAFTDAKSKHTGLIEQADGGTLFLDEIDSLPTKGQISLLRFLQDQQFRPLGSARTLQSDVAIISATNVDLSQRVKEGLFREDLLFRINVINIQIPPLRERGNDVLLLSEHFLQSFAQSYGQGEKRLDTECSQWLCHHPWPGNIRELQNTLHKAYLLSDSEIINLQHCQQSQPDQARQQAMLHLSAACFDQPFDQIRQQLLDEFENQYLHQLMKKTRGNISAAARLIAKERRSLGRLLDKHGIDRTEYMQLGPMALEPGRKS